MRIAAAQMRSGMGVTLLCSALTYVRIKIRGTNGFVQAVPVYIPWGTLANETLVAITPLCYDTPQVQQPSRMLSHPSCGGYHNPTGDSPVARQYVFSLNSLSPGPRPLWYCAVLLQRIVNRGIVSCGTR